MNDTEGLQLDPANLSEITINGTMVPMFKQFGKQWYQLITLLRALEFPETGFGGLPTKIGNQFWDSGEFLKYKDIWYGTAKGLSLYAEDLQTYQYSPTGSPKDKHTARIRQTILNQWLPRLNNSSGTAEQAPENGMEYESNTDAVPPPAAVHFRAFQQKGFALAGDRQEKADRRVCVRNQVTDALRQGDAGGIGRFCRVRAIAIPGERAIRDVAGSGNGGHWRSPAPDCAWTKKSRPFMEGAA